MSEAAILKEFLVSLGFKIDPTSERRFTDSIGAATVKAVALGAAIATTATAVVAGVAKIAESLEQLYFASARTNASVENLQATGFAAKQMGVDAAAALGAVESLARFLRNSPGGEGMLKNLGVNTRDARGAMRDTVDLMGDLGKKFAAMPYYKANAFAQALGIDEKTLMAMRAGMGTFQGQYKDMLRAAGMDSQQAAKQSHDFMSELRLFGGAFTILAQKIGVSLMGPMGTAIRRAREGLVANFGAISAAIAQALSVVVHITDAVIAMAIRGGQAVGWLVDWFRGLSPEAKAVIEIIGGILLAWKALNAGFLATPLGAVVALGVAIAALIDDYKVWKEGGKSLINWKEWEPQIRDAVKGLRELGGALYELGGVLLKIFKPALSAVGDVLMGAIKTGFGNLLDMVAIVTDLLTGKWESAGKRAQAMMSRTADFARATFGSIAAGASATVANARASIQEGAAASAPAATARPATPAGYAPTSKDARGLRNNNPGNIEYGNFTRAHGATGVEGAGRFAVFGNAQQGLDALGDLLRSKTYIAGGVDSVRAIISKYAPSSDNNNTAAYIANVAKGLGIDPNSHIDPRNTQQMSGLIDAIVRVENGKNPYSREMIAHAAGGQVAPVAVSQSTTITVHASGDGKSIAQDVSKAQNDVNAQLVRNTRGAVLQ